MMLLSQTRLLLFLSVHVLLTSAFQAPRINKKFRLLPLGLSFDKQYQDDPVLHLPLMEAELVTIAETDKKRQELQTAISDAKMAAELGVRRTQVKFYEAFSNRDVDSMRELWSETSEVRCIHPGMESLEGLESIMESWAAIFQGEAFTISPSRVKIDILGQTALCSCIEETPSGGQIEALNVYRREKGSWRMTLHMASPIVMRRSQGSL